MRAVFTLFLLLSAAVVFGQFADDFSDGDLFNPDWQGDLAHFVVNGDQQLQLNAPGAGSSTLYLQSNVPDSAVWELWFKMDFSPSQSNRLTVYLLAQNEDLANADAIFVSIGENGTGDALVVSERVAGNTSPVGMTAPGSVANGPVEVRLRFEKINQNARLSADLSGGHNFVNVASWTSAATTGGNKFFGFICEYSATRKDKFFFDDLSLQKWTPDTTPPQLTEVQAIDATHLTIGFDEAIDAASIQADHFSLSGNIGMPAAAQPVPGQASKVTLTLAQALLSGQEYTITATAISDTSGNEGSSSLNFTFVLAEAPDPFDILINELLPDPTPSAGLPEEEFVELYNRSDKAIDLSDCTLKVNNTERPIPEFLILPGTYVILAENAGPWMNFGEVIPMDLPTLTNSGATVALGCNGTLIHRIDYDLHSYRDAVKDDGGWSLELVNPQNPCLGKTNLRACDNLLGGTPGQINSVLDTAFGMMPLQMVSAYPDSPTQIHVRFNQMPGMEVTGPDVFTLSPNVAIQSVTLTDEEVVLTLADALEAGVLYTLTLNAGTANCTGNNPAQQQTLKTGLPQIPAKGEVLINEVLFNPVKGGSDYVELYNASGKIFDLRQFFLNNPDKPGDIEAVTAADLLFPHEYVALTEDVAQVIAQYLPPDTASIVSSSLPPMDNDRGGVVLLFQGQPIDSMGYDEDMHLSFISDPEGVALERIRTDVAGGMQRNWASAASGVNYGTPGYANSQMQTLPEEEDWLSITPAVFSPDGDGFDDFVTIRLKMPEADYILTVRIFDEQGHFISYLSNGRITGKDDFILWDGTDEMGTLLPEGIYLLQFTATHASGDVRKAIKSCAIVRN